VTEPFVTVNAAGVPVEATGGPGTALGHWRETTFGAELMTGWAGPGTNLPLSRVTVGALADMGYTVNFAAADNYTLGSRSSAALRSTGSNSSTASIAALTADDGTLSSLSGVVDAGVSDRTPREAPWRAALAQAAERFVFGSSSNGTFASSATSIRGRQLAADDSGPSACSDPEVADAAWGSLADEWDAGLLSLSLA
jgi:hypothetical protein